MFQKSWIRMRSFAVLTPTIVIIEDNILLAQDLEGIVASHAPNARILTLGDLESAAVSIAMLRQTDIAMIGVRSEKPDLAQVIRAARQQGLKVVFLGDTLDLAPGEYHIPGLSTNESVAGVMAQLLRPGATG